MWKIIFNNLWSRRKHNIWIFAELIAVTIVLFAILDNFVVSLYDSMLPLGYDSDRLCVVDLSVYDSGTPQYKTDRSDSVSTANDVLFLMNKIKSLPEVENATFHRYQYLNCYSLNMSHFFSGKLEMDTIYNVGMMCQTFHSGYNFFETYGVRSVEGSPSVEELSKMSYAENDIIITKSIADIFYPGEDIIGKTVFRNSYDSTATRYRVVGIVEDVRYHSTKRTGNLVFKHQPQIELFWGAKITVRLKAGIDVENFVECFAETMTTEMEAGNIYAESIKSYDEIISEFEYDSGVTSTRSMYSALALFFLCNLVVGVIGTFWYSTRRRKGEIGIMRSFGATRWNIRYMLLGEGVILSVVSVVLGCVVYLQYAIAEGLAGTEMDKSFNSFNFMDTWVTHFGEHFMIISLLCYVVITITVLIGIYLPARNISNIEPIDALRNDG